MCAIFFNSLKSNFFIFIKKFVCPERTVYSQTLNLKPKSDHIVYKMLLFIKLEIWTWIKSDNERCFCKQKTASQFNDFFNMSIIYIFSSLRNLYENYIILYYFTIWFVQNYQLEIWKLIKSDNDLCCFCEQKTASQFCGETTYKSNEISKKDTWGRI